MALKSLFVIFCLPLVYAISVKKGVAVKKSDFFCEDMEFFDHLHWWYDWRCSLNYYRHTDVCGDAINAYEDKYVSMIWSYHEDTDPSCYELNADGVLGMNEPNHVKQANMSPEAAAEAWKEMEKVTSSDRVLVSPSPAGLGCIPPKCNYGNMTWWFDQFFLLCEGCRVDYIATHLYKCNANATMDVLQDLYNRYNKKIWLTEFACRDPNNDPDRVYAYMQEVVPLLEAADYIERYAWFMMRIKDNSKWVQTSASLTEPDSYTLTPLGQLYISL